MSIKETIKSLLGSAGIRIMKVDRYSKGVKPMRYRGEALAGAAIVSRNTMIPRVQLLHIFECVDYLHRYRIPGALVECGVWKGGAAGMMAYAAKFFGDIRPLYLFDVFGDTCEPDARFDGARGVKEIGGMEMAQGRLRQVKGIYDRLGGHGTIEICRELLEGRLGYPGDRIRYVQGWFQETMPEATRPMSAVALLHIDADWYASTSTALSNIYPKVSKGGMVIIDDYGGYEGCRRAVDEFVESTGEPVFLNDIDGKCVYWVRNG